MYVTYLVIYNGDKLPPYYIGSTSLKNFENGYCGSVRSKKYKEIFKQEIKFNKILFNAIILSKHNTRIEAFETEFYLQKMLDVVKSNLFFNESYASINGCYGRDVSGSNNPMFGKKQSVKTKKLLSVKRGHDKRYEPTEEHKKIISQTHIRKLVSDETRKKISETKTGKYVGKNGTFFGKKHSDEAKKKISEAHMGKLISNETRKKISESNIGKKISIETRKKISESKIGKKRNFSQEWRDNISKGNKGKIISEETKQKLKQPRISSKSICPHCGFCGGGGNMKRYHFENCKNKLI